MNSKPQIVSKLPSHLQVGYSRLLLRLFLAVVLFISFPRCGGGGDTPEPDNSTSNPDTADSGAKSNGASISKLSFTVNEKNYDATISEEEITVNLPFGTTIPSQVTVASLEHTPNTVSSVSEGETLKVSNGKATITITSKDQTTTKTYTINFITEVGVKVTFNVNDDITTIPPLDVKKGDKASIPTEPMPENGKSFGYWATVMGSTNANYGNNLFDFDNTPINEDITLYAVWQEKPETKNALISLIDAAISDQGDTPNLKFINTSLITDMSELFKDKTTFNGDIRDWDTSNVTNMASMFSGADVFNQDIGDWDTSKVTLMASVFYNTKVFDQDIGDWDTSKVINMQQMFSNAKVFNQDIGDWDTSKVINMTRMFRYASKFDKDISNWKVDRVSAFSRIFDNCRIRTEYKPARFR